MLDRLFSSGRHCVAAILSGLVVTAAVLPAPAQHFQFSQYNFTPQRVNPALVAGSNDAQLAFIYRNQATGAGFRLSSNSLNAMYPIQSRQGIRWSGVGLSLLDDRSGQAGMFVTQEAGVSYAINLFLKPDQSLALGTRVLYRGQRVDLAGLYTGSQYIPDRGFDEGLSPGENFGELKSDYITFSLGLRWQKEDKDGTVSGYWDVSFFDLNRPAEQFMTARHLIPTFVAGGGLRVYRGRDISVFPQVLYTRSAANNVFNAGAVFRYDLREARQSPRHLDLLASYIAGRSAVMGLQFHQARLGIGVSYDFPFLYRNVANTGAVEVGLVLKKEIIRNRKTRAKEKPRNDTREEVARTPKKLSAVGVKKPLPVRRDAPRAPDSDPAGTMSERLRQKQDSLAARGTAGMIHHDPLVLEKATLRFNFEFNSSIPDEEAHAYLNELAGALRDNPELKLKLVGHTDNVGSDKFNLRLSIDRAKAIRDYLLDRGVDASRVTVEGKGLREPLNGNGTPEEQALNRRVEMTILYD